MGRALLAAALLISGGCSGESGGGAGLGDGVDLGAPDGALDDSSESTDGADGIDGLQDTAPPEIPKPCIRLNPAAVDFGSVAVGSAATLSVSIESCSADTRLIVSTVSLSEDASPGFSLKLVGFGAPGATELAPSDWGVVVYPGRSLMLSVRYEPTEVNPLGPGGLQILDHGAIRITSDAEPKLVAVALSGVGIEPGVADVLPVIEVTEGDEVIPDTTLHLIGSQSLPVGGIKRYEWTVEPPLGSTSVFLPSALAADPSFQVRVSGEYVFRLHVFDHVYQQSSEAAEYRVWVLPDEAIRVELVWRSADGLDGTGKRDKAGSDLDLHFAHPDAAVETGTDLDGLPGPDPWFAIPLDCFWFNAHPNWESLNPTVNDNPSLSNDVDDGTGPEILLLARAQPDRTYRVGVYHFNDHGFGPALATVRVYTYGTLRLERADVRLAYKDMWEVATVAWPSREVVGLQDPAGGAKIIPNYPRPLPNGL